MKKFILVLPILLFGCQSSDHNRPVTMEDRQLSEQVSNYVNDEWNISLEYASDWDILERVVQGDLSVRLFPDINNKTGASLTVSVDQPPFFLQCSECQNLQDVGSVILEMLKGEADIETRNLDLNGKSAVEVTYNYADAYFSRSVYIMENNRIYTISHITANEVLSKYQNGFDKVFSSVSINN